jgi:ankyrin repeat protein
MDLLLDEVKQESLIDTIRLRETLHPGSTSIVDEKGYSVLHWCAYLNELAALRRLLECIPSATALLSLGDHKGDCPIHIAVSQNSLSVIDYLIDKYPHTISLVNKFRETPLHLAAATGNNKCASLLVKSGASTTVTDIWDRTPLKVSRDNGYAHLFGDELGTETVSPANAGIETIRTNRPEIVAEFMQTLSDKKKNQSYKTAPSVVLRHIFSDTTETVHTTAQDTVNAFQVIQSSAGTSLSKLVEYPGNKAEVEALLRRSDVQVNGKDMFGLTALHKFAGWDQPDLLHLLLSRDDVNMNPTDANGWTPLHTCVDMGARRTLTMLVEDRRVVVDVRDKRGRTAADLAEERSAPDMKALLVSRMS